MTSRLPVPLPDLDTAWHAESLADHYLLMERGEFVMRGRGETMSRDGVREALAV